MGSGPVLIGPVAPAAAVRGCWGGSMASPVIAARTARTATHREGIGTTGLDRTDHSPSPGPIIVLPPETGKAWSEGLTPTWKCAVRPSEPGRGEQDRVMGILPRSPAYARWVGVLHLRRMNAASTEERSVEEAKQAIAWLERSRRIRRDRMDKRGEAWTQRDEFSDLMTRAQIAPAALVAGDVEKAERYANEILRTREVAMAGEAPTHVDWGARESYIAHIVLGKVVLARGEVGAASEHLRLASRAAPPPHRSVRWDPIRSLLRPSLSRVKGRRWWNISPL